MTDIFIHKIPKKYGCKICDYATGSKKDYGKHILTLKHQNASIILTKNPKNPKKTQNIEQISNQFECKCGNIYKHRQSLHKHRIICGSFSGPNSIIDKNDMTQKMIELIMSKNQDFISELVSNMTQSNKDVIGKMMELMPQIGNYSHNTNSNNTTNNQFNIQMFLNEHCKNAMNLTDFIDSLPITAATYDSTIENGLTKTLTNMITNGLSKLDILERPIHCTDAARKTLYVKEANTWEKDIELIRMLLGIKTLARKQRMMINKWQDANDGWEKEDYIQTKLTTLISHSMTNIESDEKETNKIIRAVSKNVYLDNEEKNKYLC